jgi:hypothetical protein
VGIVLWCSYKRSIINSVAESERVVLKAKHRLESLGRTLAVANLAGIFVHKKNERFVFFFGWY